MVVVVEIRINHIGQRNGLALDQNGIPRVFIDDQVEIDGIVNFQGYVHTLGFRFEAAHFMREIGIRLNVVAVQNPDFHH